MNKTIRLNTSKKPTYDKKVGMRCIDFIDLYPGINYIKDIIYIKDIVHTKGLANDSNRRPYVGLPNSVWQMILEHLSQTDLITCARLSKRLFQIAQQMIINQTESILNKYEIAEAIVHCGNNKLVGCLMKFREYYTIQLAIVNRTISDIKK